MGDIEVGDLVEVNKDYYKLFEPFQHNKTGIVVGVNRNAYFVSKGNLNGDQIVVHWPDGIHLHPGGSLIRVDV